jgi:hypothetical protein
MGSSAALGQTTPQPGPPPPPSDEYFPQRWVDYSSTGKFKIRFPKPPREYTERQQDATVYVAEYKGLLLYVATYGDSLLHISDPKDFLRNISQAWLDANSARKPRVVNNEDTSVGTYPAKFLQVETQRHVVRIRWIVVNNRIYYQFVAAPKDQVALESANGYEKLAMNFINSFELTK